MNSIPTYAYLALLLALWFSIESTIKVVFLKIMRNNINTISIGNIRLFGFTVYKTTIDIGLLPLTSNISYESLIFKTTEKKAIEDIVMNIILIVSLAIISILLMGVDLWIDSIFQMLKIFDLSSENTVIPLSGFSKLEIVGFFTLVLFFLNLLPLKGTYLWNILHSVFVDVLNKKLILSIVEYAMYSFIVILLLITYFNS